ncbi:unnamed protein product, partial [marine sediment metagenome]
ETLPQRAATARSLLSKRGKMMGMNDDVVAELDRQFIRRVGPEAGKLTSSRWTIPASARKAGDIQAGEAKRLAAQAGVPEEKLAEVAGWATGQAPRATALAPTRGVPFGAGRTGWQKLPFVGKYMGHVGYGKGAAGGVPEALRPAEAFRMREAELAAKTELQMEKLAKKAGIKSEFLGKGRVRELPEAVTKARQEGKAIFVGTRAEHDLARRMAKTNKMPYNRAILEVQHMTPATKKALMAQEKPYFTPKVEQVGR